MWNGLIDPNPSPLDRLERDEELEMLRLYVARHLPTGILGVVVRMSMVEDKTLQEIAQAVRMSPKGVAEMVKRGGALMVAQMRAEYAARVTFDREQRRLFNRRGVQKPAAGSGRRRPPRA
jgi:hypothetical protein